jgi:hypothetical protein
MIAPLPTRRWRTTAALPATRRSMITVAGTTVPATRRWRPRMIVPVTVAVIATVVTTTIPGGTHGNRRVPTAVLTRAVVAVTRVVVSTDRLDDRRRFRAVIRIAPGAAANVAGVVVTTRQRQGSRENEKQGMRTTHGVFSDEMTAMDDFDTAPPRLNAR